MNNLKQAEIKNDQAKRSANTTMAEIFVMQMNMIEQNNKINAQYKGLVR